MARKTEKLSNFEYLQHVGWEVTESGCWEYRGAKHQQGYGVLRRKKAHRIAYEGWVGTIPKGHVVRHACDNPPCVNPAHLEHGTQADNIQDMLDRGRYVLGKHHSGEDSIRALLSNEDARGIREGYLTGLVTYEMLGELYGVGANVVGKIVRGETYTDDGVFQRLELQAAEMRASLGKEAVTL